MMGGTAPLLRIVAHLSPGLLLPVAHHDGRVQHQRQLLRDTAGQRPALPDHPPEELVEERDHPPAGPPQPAPEGRGVRNTDPAEDPAHAAAVEEREVIHHPTTIELQRDPDLRHQPRAEEPLLLLYPAIDPGGQAEPVEELAHKHKTGAVGKVLRAVTDA